MVLRKKVLSIFVTLFTVLVAFVALVSLFRDYIFHPWTRDGQVRAEVIQITPRVSGPIVELPIIDNQFVGKGEVLMRIDPRTFEAKVLEAKANLAKAIAVADESTAENDRIQNIYKRDPAAVSKRKVTATGHAMKAAFASVRAAEADLVSAELDLSFTEINAPVDGLITNLNIQIGSQVNAGTPVLALIDTQSYWVSGFFKETQIRNINPGDEVEVVLMSYPNHRLNGVVESMGWGISREDGSADIDLLPYVNPSFDWIRLAQRVPVRVRLNSVPSEVELRVGTTASVFIK